MIHPLSPPASAARLWCSVLLVACLLVPDVVTAATTFGQATFGSGLFGGCSSDAVTTLGIRKGMPVRMIELESRDCALLEPFILYLIHTGAGQSSSFEDALRMADNDGIFYLYHYSDNFAYENSGGQFLPDHFGASQGARTQPALWQMLQNFANGPGHPPYTWQHVGSGPADIRLAANQRYLVVVIGGNHSISRN